MSGSAPKKTTPSPPFRGSDTALARAGESARKLAVQTGTSVYVFQDGKVVDAATTKAKAKK